MNVINPGDWNDEHSAADADAQLPPPIIGPPPGHGDVPDDEAVHKAGAHRRGRRWVLLSLVALLVLIGAAIGWWVSNVRQNYYEMQRLGTQGLIFSDEPVLPPTLMDWADKAHIDFLHQPTGLIANFVDADRIDWRAVGRMTSLRVVAVNMSKLNDDDLQPLGNLTGLDKLILMGNPITDKGLAHLTAMTRLRELNLAMTHVTDAGLPRLKSLKNLYALNLAGTKVTDAGIERLRQALPDAHINR